MVHVQVCFTHRMHVNICAKGWGKGWLVVRFPAASFKTDSMFIVNYLLSMDQLMRFCFQWVYNLYWIRCRKNSINTHFFATYIVSNVKYVVIMLYGSYGNTGTNVWRISMNLYCVSLSFHIGYFLWYHLLESHLTKSLWNNLPSLKVLKINAVIYREKGTSQSKLKADSEISVTLARHHECKQI